VVAVRIAQRESRQRRPEREQRSDRDDEPANVRLKTFERREQQPDHAPTADTAREISDPSYTPG
jgi:hypothetical protein